MGHPCNLFWFIFVFSSNKRKRGPLKTPIFVDLSSTHQTIRLLSCTNCEYLAKIHTHLVKRYSIYAHRQTDTQTDRQTDTQTDRHTDRQTDTQTDRHTDRPTDRHTFCIPIGGCNIFYAWKFIPFHFSTFIHLMVEFGQKQTIIEKNSLPPFFSL